MTFVISYYFPMNQKKIISLTEFVIESGRESSKEHIFGKEGRSCYICRECKELKGICRFHSDILLKILAIILMEHCKLHALSWESKLFHENIGAI